MAVGDVRLKLRGYTNFQRYYVKLYAILLQAGPGEVPLTPHPSAFGHLVI